MNDTKVNITTLIAFFGLLYIIVGGLLSTLNSVMATFHLY